MRCRARRSLAVKRLLIGRGIRRVAAQATKRAAVLAACCAAWSAVAAQATKRKRLNGQLCSRPEASKRKRLNGQL